MNYLLNPLIRLTSGTTASDEIEEMGYDFDDLNATLVGHLGSRSRLHVNFFGGRDRLRLSEQFIGMTGTMPWFNLGASAAVSTEFDDHTGMEHSLVFSRFGNELSLHLADLSVQTRSRITTAGYCGKVRFRLAGLPWEGGVQYRLHLLLPQEFDKRQGDLFAPGLSYGENRAHEASAFLGTKLELFRRLTLEPGAQALCYLLPRNCKVSTPQGDRWESRCNLTISGYGELALRAKAGQILHADNPVIVYEGDEFSFGERDGRKYVNYCCRIPRQSNRIIACFLKITRPDGTVDYSVMTEADWKRLEGFSAKNNAYYDSQTRPPRRSRRRSPPLPTRRPE